MRFGPSRFEAKELHSLGFSRPKILNNGCGCRSDNEGSVVIVTTGAVNFPPIFAPPHGNSLVHMFSYFRTSNCSYPQALRKKNKYEEIYNL